MRPLNRYLEIDLLRTLAIAMMVVYHTAFDLSEFYGFAIDPYSGNWKLLARATAVLFLLLVGSSGTLLWRSMRLHGENDGRIRRRFWRRGLWVLVCAMVITLVTLIIGPETYVRFGILHLIGVSLLLLPFFLGWKEWNIVLALPLLAAHFLVADIRSSSPLWLPFGIYSTGFATLDYFPLLPWFGMVLLGAGLAHAVYGHNTPLGNPKSGLRKILDRLWNLRLVRLLSLPGRHSLVLYMAHQPLILLLLYVFLGRPS